MIRIGLLGASRISRGAVLKLAAKIDDVEVSAVAARDPACAAAFAEELGVQYVDKDYDALIARDGIDLVYHGLPPTEHARWPIAALEAGKHVPCEKPFAMNADEARAMAPVAERTGKHLIEAFHYRFHPLWDRILAMLGTIGAVQRLDSHFNVPVAFRPGELRYDRALGGGAMMDLGCYPVHWVRTMMNDEPVVISAAARKHESGVDVTMVAELEFAGRVPAHLSASMSEDLPEGLDVALKVTGELGSLTVSSPLVPHIGNELLLETKDSTRSQRIPGESTYYYQLGHVVDVPEGRADQITGGQDATGNIRVEHRDFKRGFRDVR